jgi:hypothetical protein
MLLINAPLQKRFGNVAVPAGSAAAMMLALSSKVS